MRVIEWIQGLSIEATGGVAIYIIMCTAFVTIVGVYGTIKHIVGWVR